MHLYRNMIRKIRRSLGRYLSLLGIAMLASGFFAGIQATVPDVVQLADGYFREHSLMDFKIVSPLGLTGEDAAALEKLEGVGAAVPTYSLDLLNRDRAVRVHALEENINLVTLQEGRLPAAPGECVADRRSYRVGDRIRLSGEGADSLRHREFSVTGTADSVLYLYEDYGVTSAGDGKLGAFLFVLPSEFDLDAYTEIVLTAPDAGKETAWSPAYQQAAERVKERILGIQSRREDARYDALYQEGQSRIAEEEQALLEAKREGEEALKKAGQKLQDSRAKLESEQKRLTDGQQELERQKSLQLAKLQEEQSRLDESQAALTAALAQSGLTAEALPGAMQELEGAISALQEQLAQLPPESPQAQELGWQLASLSESAGQLARLSAGLQELEAGGKQLSEGRQRLEREFAERERQIQEGMEKIQKGRQELEEGYAAYEKEEADFFEKIEDGEKKLEEARVELSELERPKWHIFGREAAVGYEDLKSANEIVGGVAAAFPAFFIILVLLMSSNSMSRMITEERGEMGTLASLGYSGARMVSGYLVYVLSATLTGAAAGFFLGCAIIPRAIYDNFQFNLPPFVTHFDLPTLALILAVTAILMSGVTIYACGRELRRPPSALLRPLPPREGQIILLERIRPLWKRLSFTWKVTLRNLFRYKKRALMTIVGIGGCASFLVVGFGLRDSMDGAARRQYEQFHPYDVTMILKNEIGEPQGVRELYSALSGEGLSEVLLVRQSALKFSKNGEKANATLIVPEDLSRFPDFYKLLNPHSGEPVALTDGGAVLTRKLAEILDAQPGDTVSFTDPDHREYRAKVIGVTENYLSNYVYMTPAGYADSFGKAAAFNSAVARFEGDETALAKQLLAGDRVLNTVFTGDVVETANKAVERLASVVVLIVLVACALAFMVLYNLTSINISERSREIATLKVLGFTDPESGAYIYREAILLTAISIAGGMVLGTVLHSFLLDAIEGFQSLFVKTIRWYSFAGSAILTIVFSTGMQIITYFKTRSVDMTGSLKSVE